MSKQLPTRPNMGHLRDQAKKLLSAARSGDSAALQRFRDALPSFHEGSALALHDAQSVVAREYGFQSWLKLAGHVEEIRAKVGITPEIEAAFIEAATGGFPGRLARLLELYPGLPRHSILCGIVSAELDLVREANPLERLGPRNATPIEYLAYSRIGSIFPDRYNAMTECARVLLDGGADPNTYTVLDNGGHIPVLYAAAAESQHAGIAELLLERGANPNDGESIYHAAEHGNVEILELLEAYGGDMRTPGHLGFMIYYRGFDPNSEATLRGAVWLLDRGATPNVFGGMRHETPLHAACRFARGPELLDLLLDHGADASLQDGGASTPYQIAFSVGNRVAMEVLEQRGLVSALTVEDRFLAACASDDEYEIRQVIFIDPEILDRTDVRGKDMLARFAETGHIAGVRGLLAAGFSVTGDGFATPLHFASIQGQVETASLLIDCGAPLDVRDDDHNSPPIGWAAFGSMMHRHPGGDHAEVIRRLIAAGSSVDDALEQLDADTYAGRPPEIGEAIATALSRRKLHP